MQIRQLEAFRTTVLHGTMSSAAQRLKTSQPTVSRLLSDLEASLGFPLFVRRKGKVLPTREGMQFYERLDEVFGAFVRLRGAVDDIRRDRNRAIRIVSLPALSMSVIPAIIAEFAQRRPDVSVNLTTVDVPTYFNVIREADVDIAFGNQLGDQPSIEQVTLAEVDFVCALPPGHRLGAQESVGLEDLVGERIISLAELNHGIFRRHDELFDQLGDRVTRPFFTQNSPNAYAMVLKGLGIGILEPFSADFWRTAGVQIRPFRSKLSYKYAASFNRNAVRSESTMALFSAAKTVFARFQN